MEDIIISKEQFLIEHNRLSPENLKVTFALLTRFQEEKRPLLKDNNWSHKLRIPLITWLMALPPRKEKPVKRPKDQGYKIYQ